MMAGTFLGASPASVFLHASVDKAGHARLAIAVKHADALGPVEAVGAESKELDAEFAHVDGQPANGRGGVHVERHILFRGDGADFLHRLDGADVVIDQMNRHQNRLLGDGLPNILGINASNGIDRDSGYFEAVLGQKFDGIQDRRMFGGGKRQSDFPCGDWLRQNP